MLAFYKQLIKIRKQERTLQEGELRISAQSNSKYLIYERILQGERTLIMLNFSKKNHSIKNLYKKSKQLFSTLTLDKQIKLQEIINLQPFEAVIIKAIK